MIILASECIPSKNNQPDRDGCKDGNDNDPDNRIINILFPVYINIAEGTLHQFINNKGGDEEKKEAEVSFEYVHERSFEVFKFWVLS
jgi:hypothetical protein